MQGWRGSRAQGVPAHWSLSDVGPFGVGVVNTRTMAAGGWGPPPRSPPPPAVRPLFPGPPSVLPLCSEVEKLSLFLLPSLPFLPVFMSLSYTASFPFLLPSGLFFEYCFLLSFLFFFRFFFFPPSPVLRAHREVRSPSMSVVSRSPQGT